MRAGATRCTGLETQRDRRQLLAARSRSPRRLSDGERLALRRTGIRATVQRGHSSTTTVVRLLERGACQRIPDEDSALRARLISRLGRELYFGVAGGVRAPQRRGRRDGPASRATSERSWRRSGTRDGAVRLSSGGPEDEERARARRKRSSWPRSSATATAIALRDILTDRRPS